MRKPKRPVQRRNYTVEAQRHRPRPWVGANLTELPPKTDEQVDDSLQQRLRKMRGASAKLRWRRRFVFLAILLAMAALSYLLFFSPVFQLRMSAVAVSGADSHISQNAVMEKLSRFKGQSIMRISHNRVSAAVSEITWVDTVEVRRALPNGFRISVTSRIPLLRAQLKGQEWIVDPSGMLMVPDAATDPELPKAMLDSRAGGKTAASVMAVLPKEVRSEVLAIDATNPQLVKITLADSRQIIWGDTSRGDLKAKVIGLLLDQPGKVFDVTDPIHPSARI
ncbi:MAG: FtsQ-type POTRA domain-containing protein [Varibaculum sp.]|nr:FtsQ-type POTRA domain-containing protein [Varibaculum sp.]